jgi:hypothetical protein
MSGTSGANAVISVFRNNIRTSVTANASAAGAWTATLSGLAPQAGDVITAVAATTGTCPSTPSTGVSVYAGVTGTPVITGAYCVPASGGTSLALSGTGNDIGSAAPSM